MSLLQQIHRGLRHVPPRLLIYGTEGIGKSTTASQALQPIFLATEDGLDQIDCDSFPLARRVDEVLAALSTLYTEPHDYQSVVIDSLDWLERLIWDDVCHEYGVKSIEKADGGYAKGYTHALTPWREVLIARGAPGGNGRAPRTPTFVPCSHQGASAPPEANTIPSGQRNATLARLGGTMRRVGMSREEILAALCRVNQDRCKPPLSAREVQKIAASISRYEPDQVAVALALTQA